MWDRTLTIGSAGKTFSVTGWKVSHRGWEAALPPWSSAESQAWELREPLARPREASFPARVLVQVGWVLGPDHIMRHLRTVHQNSIFHCPTQGQVRRGRAPFGRVFTRTNENGQAGSSVRAQLTCLSICPSQAAVAKSFEREQLHVGQPSSYFVQFPKAMQRNRDHMTHSLQSVGLEPVMSHGSYFLIADISDFSE